MNIIYRQREMDIFSSLEYYHPIFDHRGVPEDKAPHIETGWYNRYWEPLQQYLSNL